MKVSHGDMLRYPYTEVDMFNDIKNRTRVSLRVGNGQRRRPCELLPSDKYEIYASKWDGGEVVLFSAPLTLDGLRDALAFARSIAPFKGACNDEAVP